MARSGSQRSIADTRWTATTMHARANSVSISITQSQLNFNNFTSHDATRESNPAPDGHRDENEGPGTSSRPAPVRQASRRAQTHTTEPSPPPLPPLLPPSSHQRQIPSQTPSTYRYPPRTHPYTTYTQEGRIMLPFSEKWFRGKLALTITALTCAFINFFLALALVKEGGDGYDAGQAAVIIAMIMIIFTSAELLVLYMRSRHQNCRRGIHPLPAVWIQLGIFVACIVAAGFAIVRHGDISELITDCAAHLLDLNPRYAYCRHDPHYTDMSYNSGFYLPALRALAAMFCLSAIVHSALFVCAFVDLDQRRRLRHAGLSALSEPEMERQPSSPVAVPYYPLVAQETPSNTQRDVP